MEILTTKEVAAYLHMHEKKVYQLVKGGEVPHTRIGGKIVFAREIIDRWIQENTLQEQTLLISGSDDPLLKDVIELFNRQGKWTIFYAALGSVLGLQQLQQKKATMSCAHILNVDGSHSLDYLGRYLNHKDFVVVRLFSRSQGIYLAPDNPMNIKKFNQLDSKKVRFATRTPGSGTRLIIDYLVRKHLKGTDLSNVSIAGSHLAAGMKVITKEVDASFGIRYVAHMLGLQFIPMLEEPFDLVIPLHHWERKSIRDFVGSFSPEHILASLGGPFMGYDITKMGTVIWNPSA